MGKPESQSSAVRQEFRRLEQILECRLKIRNVPEVGDNGWNLLVRGRTNHVQVVSEGDPTTARDLENLVFNVTVECDVCDGGGRLL